MEKKELKEAIGGLKEIRDTLTGNAHEFADGVVTTLEKVSDEISTKVAQLNEEAADRDQKLRNDVAGMLNAGKSVEDKFTPAVKKAIANAIMNSHGVRNTMDSIEKVCKDNGIEVRKKNSVSGLTYTEIIDYALQLKQEDNDEIFDALYKTNRSKWFYGELDPTAAKNIAKQWDKDSETQKEEQELALNGKVILTNYLYTLQSLANEDLDEAREAGQEVELLSDIRDELIRAVKGLAVRAILVGDTYNPNGSKVTVFETIGSKTTTDLFTTVVNPKTALTVTLADVRKAAAAVKTSQKWAVMTSDLKLALATRLYAAGGTEFFFSDEELADQLGVDKVIAKDFIGEIDGLHAIIFDPSEYWVKMKNVIDTPFPEYRDNRQGYVYEINMGGAIHGLQSTAVLCEGEAES